MQTQSAVENLLLVAPMQRPEPAPHEALARDALPQWVVASAAVPCGVREPAQEPAPCEALAQATSGREAVLPLEFLRRRQGEGE